MDASEFNKSEGSCIISEEVIASIASTAAMETAGVAELASRPADLKGIMLSTPATKAVKVVNTENETVLDVYIKLRQGAKIQDTATAVQQQVKTAVQAMTGKPVTRVNIHVEGMVLEEKEN